MLGKYSGLDCFLNPKIKRITCTNIVTEQILIIDYDHLEYEDNYKEKTAISPILHQLFRTESGFNDDWQIHKLHFAI